AGRDVGLSGDHAEQRGLARAVRPEQAGDAGRDVERHVADGNDVAEPARHALDPDHGSGGSAHGVNLRYRSQRIAPGTSVQAKYQARRTGFGSEPADAAPVLPAASPKIMSFTCTGISIRLNIEIHCAAAPSSSDASP